MNKFDIEIFDPHPPRFVPNHKKIVSALQNSILDPIDLLVRESVQNSLDAAKDVDKQGRNVTVAFKCGNFNPERFAAMLDDDSALSLKKSVERHKLPSEFMAIRDVNCVGLTGSPDDPDSNVFKLIYGFLNGKGATLVEGDEGGSVGVGKTVFLHFGIGLVIYYSHTVDGEHRLAMFYCKNTDRVKLFEGKRLPYNLAWWGKAFSKTDTSVRPVEDESFIRKFLDVFGIEPYSDRETGTTIVIPFFSAKPPRQDEIKGFKPWTESLSAYLRFSVMKWYAPRYRADLKELADEEDVDFIPYKWGSYLRCTFPDKQSIRSSLSVEERKVFGLIRNLYDTAVGVKKQNTLIRRFGVVTRDVPSNDPPLYFKQNVLGWMAIAKLDVVNGEYAGILPLLNSLAPDESVADRKGFVLYCRRPGMIMSYDSSWDKVLSGARRGENEFFIGIFVVNSDNLVGFGSYVAGSCKLDQLFRETEKSDHYGWPIGAMSHGFKLVNRVVNYLKNTISETYGAREQLPETQPDQDMSRGLGTIFMDGRTGFGGTPDCVEGNGGIQPVEEKPERTNKKHKSSVGIGDYEIGQDAAGVFIKVPVLIKVDQSDREITLAVVVEADGKAIGYSDWLASDGKYPVSADDFQLATGKAEVVTAKENAACVIGIEEGEKEIVGTFIYHIAEIEMSTSVRRES